MIICQGIFTKTKNPIQMEIKLNKPETRIIPIQQKESTIIPKIQQQAKQKTKKHKLQESQVQFWQNKYPPKSSKALKGYQENNRMQNSGLKNWR